MKPVRFDYHQVTDSREISGLLLQPGHHAKIMAGGQSLGPMLNLRLVQPTLVVDISRLSGLKTFESDTQHLDVGACVTHANLEDGCIPGITGQTLATVARGIAYRAVRNRGTLGGSLAHADPSADWITTLMAMHASLRIRHGDQTRWAALSEAMTAAFDIGLQEGEWVESVRIPLLSADCRWGYSKICRKTGEFAHAMAAVRMDPEKRRLRMVLGATESAPVVIDHETASASVPEAGELTAIALEKLQSKGISDPIDNRIRIAALNRAIEKCQQRNRA
jgi:carbon-monoxide dehydrogenase medium subunit